jgi:hypothetical protein
MLKVELSGKKWSNDVREQKGKNETGDIKFGWNKSF